MKNLSTFNKVIYFAMLGCCIGAIISFCFKKDFLSALWVFNTFLWTGNCFFWHTEYLDLKEYSDLTDKNFDDLVQTALETNHNALEINKLNKSIYDTNCDLMETVELYSAEMTKLIDELDRVSPNNPLIGEITDDLRAMNEARKKRHQEDTELIEK